MEFGFQWDFSCKDFGYRLRGGVCEDGRLFYSVDLDKEIF